MIGKLLGHTQVQTTARYAHLARDTVAGLDSQGGGEHRGGHPAGVVKRKETDDGEVEQRNDLKANGRSAPGRRAGSRVLGPGALGFRSAGISVGEQGLLGADAGGWKVEAGDHRTARLLTAEQARRKAAVLIAGIKGGEEPGRNGDLSAGGPTLAEVGERYLREHVAVRCKPTTAGAYRQCADQVPPASVRVLPLGAIGRDQVASLHYRLHKTPTMANQVVDTLSRLFSMAEAWGVAPEGGNPCRFVKKYRNRSCERFLSEQEFRRLGRVLSELEAEGRHRQAGSRHSGY